MPGTRHFFVLAALLALAAPAWAQQSGAVPAIIRTEFAFAADAVKRGIKPAFLASMHDSAVVFPQAAPILARPHWLTRPEPDSADPLLLWAPALAGAAVSGELGYTTGPWLQTSPKGKPLAAGQFFTIWARQPDGTYRWVLDNGTSVGVLPKKKWLTPESASVVHGPVGAKPKASEPRHSPRALDEEMSADMAVHGMIGAYESHLHPKARLLRDGRAPVETMDAMRHLVSTETARVLMPAGGRLAASGDLAYSYGQYRTETAAVERGAYVHLWLHTPAGWKLLAEMINPATK